MVAWTKCPHVGRTSQHGLQGQSTWLNPEGRFYGQGTHVVLDASAT